MQGQTQEVAPTMTQNKKGTNTHGSPPSFLIQTL